MYRKLSLVLFICMGRIQTTLGLDDYSQYPWLDQISREQNLNSACSKIPNKPKLNITQLDHILVDHKHKLLYCYVPKVACTNWKRLFMVLTDQSNVSNLMDIPAYVAHSENSTLKLSQLGEKQAHEILSSYTTFIMVRNPFERILSAYTNKFRDNSTSAKYFQSRYGKYIIKSYRVKPSRRALDTGQNVSFREFTRYLINEGSASNEHWTSIYNLCQPCRVNYTFIGRYETLGQDSKTLLDMVHAPRITFPVTRAAHTKERLKSYFQQLSLKDIKQLYKLYEPDFNLFGYNLEELLGYDLA